MPKPTTKTAFLPNGDRYFFDCKVCTAANGWTQYDTTSDAWYFGVWVNKAKRRILCYAEGDVTCTTHPTEESFAAELAHMAEFYGPPPAAFTAIDTETGSVTKYYDSEAAFGRPLPTTEENAS